MFHCQTFLAKVSQPIKSHVSVLSSHAEVKPCGEVGQTTLHEAAAFGRPTQAPRILRSLKACSLVQIVLICRRCAVRCRIEDSRNSRNLDEICPCKRASSGKKPSRLDLSERSHHAQPSGRGSLRPRRIEGYSGFLAGSPF